MQHPASFETALVPVSDAKTDGEQSRPAQVARARARAGHTTEDEQIALATLLSMGFDEKTANDAVAVNGANIDAASQWCVDTSKVSAFNEAYAALTTMGFTRSQILPAIKAAGTDAQRAMNYILEHDSSFAADKPSSTTSSAASVGSSRESKGTDAKSSGSSQTAQRSDFPSAPTKKEVPFEEKFAQIEKKFHKLRAEAKQCLDAGAFESDKQYSRLKEHLTGEVMEALDGLTLPRVKLGGKDSKDSKSTAAAPEVKSTATTAATISATTDGKDKEKVTDSKMPDAKPTPATTSSTSSTTSTTTNPWATPSTSASTSTSSTTTAHTGPPGGAAIGAVPSWVAPAKSTTTTTTASTSHSGSHSQSSGSGFGLVETTETYGHGHDSKDSKDSKDFAYSYWEDGAMELGIDGTDYYDDEPTEVADPVWRARRKAILDESNKLLDALQILFDRKYMYARKGAGVSLDPDSHSQSARSRGHSGSGSGSGSRDRDEKDFKDDRKHR